MTGCMSALRRKAVIRVLADAGQHRVRTRHARRQPLTPKEVIRMPNARPRRSPSSLANSFRTSRQGSGPRRRRGRSAYGSSASGQAELASGLQRLQFTGVVAAENLDLCAVRSP